MGTYITLDKDSPEIQYLCKKDKRLKKVISMVGPITYETHDDAPYAFLIHEIIEQMLSVKAGSKIYSRFEALCNGDVTPKIVLSLSIEDIKSTGTSTSKATYILGITRAIQDGILNLDNLNSMADADVISTLTKQRGIGKWTAKMYLIFVLDRQNILPTEDAAFLQSYCWLYKVENPSKKDIIRKCAKWSPYASIASRYLYRALDLGLTKQEFHLYK